MLTRPALAVVAVTALVGPAFLVAAASPAAAATTCAVFFDVNRDGHDDLAIGSPGENVKGLEDAGTVTIAWGDANGEITGSDGRSISMEDLDLTPQAGDRFGAALLTADFNGDGCGDLAIGAPGHNSGAGIVVVVYGQPLGTPQFGSLVQTLKQGTGGAPGSSEAGDAFGSTLAVTSDGTGNPTALWVGAPSEDIGLPGPNAIDAGIVVVYPTATGAILPTSGITTRQQGSGGISGQPESGDRFGAALAASGTTVLIGVPGEDVGKTKDAGQFYAVVDGASKGYTQDSAGVPGNVEAGDQLGASVAVLASCHPGADAWVVGSPFEAVGKTSKAGMVSLLDRGTGTSLTLQQGKGGIPGSVEAGDRFGESLQATAPQPSAPTSAVLAIGAPREDVGSATNAGSVTTLSTVCPGDVLAATSVVGWTQNSPGMLDGAQPKDRFGESLGAVLLLKGTPATGTLELRLVVGVPGEDETTENGLLINSGMVALLPATSTGFTATGSTLIGQNTGDLPGQGETDDGFGSAVDSANASR